MRLPLALTVAALLVAACGGPTQSDANTVVLCVWEGADFEELKAYGAGFDSTPVLSELAVQGEVLEGFRPASRSMSASFASLMTAKDPAEHGLRSVHELGACQLAPEVETWAEQLGPRGWRTLGVASQAHFDECGLHDGFDIWAAPDNRVPARSLSAESVLKVLDPELEKSLSSDEDVLLVLHFGDLRGRTWEGLQPARKTLEHFLGEWRGKGGVIDEAFADTTSELSLGKRLSQSLLRRTDDPRKDAMLQAQYAEALRYLDQQLGRLREELVDSGRLHKATIYVTGGAAGDEAGEKPGPRETAPFIRFGPETSLMPWARSRTEASALIENSAQRERQIEVRSSAPPFKDLEITLMAHSGEVRALDGQEDRDPAADRGEWILQPSESMRAKLFGYGGDFTLRLRHPQIFALSPESVGVGALTYDKADVPMLLAAKSPGWPKNALSEPVLDLQPAGGRRMTGTLNSRMEERVEILIELFPPNPEFIAGIEIESGGVVPHDLRPGAAWLRGNGFMSFELPPRAPSERLALLLRVDGKPIAGSRIRYLDRTFVAPGSFELGLSSGVWLDEDLVGEGKPLFEPKLWIRLFDSQASSRPTKAPKAEVVEVFSQLEEDA